MSWKETLNSQQVSKDWQGRLVGLRQYRAWGYARTAILGDPTAILNDTGQGLPAHNSAWENMRLDQYEVHAVGSIFDVTALYSSYRRFSLPNHPPTLTAKSWTGSFQTESIPLPTGVWTSTKSITLVQGGSPIEQTVYGWDFESENVDHKFERMGQQVYLDASEIALALEAVANQADKVHKIRGRYYLFEPGDYAEESDGRWRMQYQWTRDPGTPSLPVVNNPWEWVPDESTAHFEYPANSGDFYARPPFHRLVLVQTGSTPASNPQYFVRRLKDHSNLLGWATLPRFTP